MNYFSFDTNLIIALVNDKDRLHKSSMNIIQNESYDCVLCKSAIKESKKIAREKIARAVANSLEIIVDIQRIKNKDKIEKELKKSFKKLMRKDPSLTNFYMFLLEKIIEYVTKFGIRFLPRYLSNLSDNMVRTFEIELGKIIEYDIIGIKYSNKNELSLLSDVKECIAPVRFKDAMDFVIFCELVFNLSKKNLIDFYTDDKEFSKKGRKAFSLLEKNLAYDSSWLTIIHTDDFLESLSKR